MKSEATKSFSRSFAAARLRPIVADLTDFPPFFLRPPIPPTGAFLNRRMFSTLRALFSFLAFNRQASVMTKGVRVTRVFAGENAVGTNALQDTQSVTSIARKAVRPIIVDFVAVD